MTTDQAVHFILYLVIASTWCVGVHAAFIKVVIEEIFGTNVEALWDKMTRTQKLVSKPLWACPQCMASVHGTVIYFTQVAQMDSAQYWIPFCICLCGLNFFVSQFFIE